MKSRAYIGLPLLLFVISCGAVDDISAMREDLSQTNAKLDDTNKKLETVAGSVNTMAGSVSQVAGAMTETNTQIRQTNSSLGEVTAGMSNLTQSVGKMEQSVQGTNEQLGKSLQFQGTMNQNTGSLPTLVNSLGRIERSMSNVESALGPDGSISRTQRELGGLRTDLATQFAKLNTNLSGMNRTLDRASNLQELNVLISGLEKYSSYVGDEKKSNKERLIAAHGAVRLLARIDIPPEGIRNRNGELVTKPDLISANLLARLRAINPSVGNQAGILFSGVGAPGRVPLTTRSNPQGAAVPDSVSLDPHLFNGQRMISGLYHESFGVSDNRFYAEVLKVAPQYLKNPLPLPNNGAYSDNFIWAQALNPELIAQLDREIFKSKDPKVLTAKEVAKSFLIVSSKMLTESLQYFCNLETAASLQIRNNNYLKPSELEEYRRRVEVILAIRNMGQGFSEPNVYGTMLETTKRLLIALKQRGGRLNKEDEQIIQSIQSLTGLNVG